MRCIEARLRLETEKEQQETLILSVIPAHIGRGRNWIVGLLFDSGLFCSFEYEIGDATESEGDSEVSSPAIERLR